MLPVSPLPCRLLQRAACARVTSAPHASIEIRRTKGRKPFLASPLPDPALAPNFNFNVSHEGDFVVLASEPVAVCGVDVGFLDLGDFVIGISASDKNSCQQGEAVDGQCSKFNEHGNSSLVEGQTSDPESNEWNRRDTRTKLSSWKTD